MDRYRLSSFTSRDVRFGREWQPLIIPRITALYSAILAALFLWLSIRVAIMRCHTETYLGESGRRLARLVRMHANFSENVPLALMLMAFVEMLGAAPMVMQTLGILLSIFRGLHAYGVAQEPEPIWFRVIGYAMSCFVIASAALAIVWMYTV